MTTTQLILEAPGLIARAIKRGWIKRPANTDLTAWEIQKAKRMSWPSERKGR